VPAEIDKVRDFLLPPDVEDFRRLGAKGRWRLISTPSRVGRRGSRHREGIPPSGVDLDALPVVLALSESDKIARRDPQRGRRADTSTRQVLIAELGTKVT
jgi:hypothetical protein